LLYASLALTNTGDYRRADSLLKIIDERRDALSAYDRSWLDFRLAFVRGDAEGTLTAIRHAARMAPGTKTAYNHAVAALQAGHPKEALAVIQTLQPDRGAMRGFASYWSLYGSVVHVLGDYDRERGIGTAAREAFPDRLIAFPALLRALAAEGKTDEISRTLSDARRLPVDPYYWDFGMLLAETAEELRAHGHMRESASYWRELRDWLSARDSIPLTRWRLVQALYALADYTTASQTLSPLLHSDADNVDYIGMSGLIAARRGDREAALAIALTLDERQVPYEFGAASLYKARIAAALGDLDTAIESLRRTFAEGRPYQVWLHRDLDFEPLRNRAAFLRLVRGKE
jgi:tetratricopeptide (TPR) repeat protein